MDKDKIDKKDHILDVAEKIFSDQGYDGASTRTISGEAGVNMAMLNYYFGSKEGLFLAIFNRKISSFRDILHDLGNDESMTSWQKVEAYIDLYAERVVNNNCFQKMLYQEMAMNRRNELSESLTTILLQNVVEFNSILKEGVQRGEFKEDIDYEMIAATIYGTKNFIINTPLMTSSMLGYDIQDEKNLEEKFKPRIKAYLHALLKAYLVKK
jgi:TetR/AcrR family transcriptional regulator